MRKLIVLIFLSVSTVFYSSAQFLSKTDVLFYLNDKTFVGGSSGDATLSFHEMGSQLTVNGNYLLYQPDIKILSKSSAIVTYWGVTNPSLKAGLVVNSSANTIMDRSNNSVYSFDPNAAAPGSFPDMSKATKIILPKANSYPNYRISQAQGGIYLVTDTKTNTPEFYFANDNLFYSDHTHRLDLTKAYDLCKNLKIGGKENWRLPSLKELEIIYGLKSQIQPAPDGDMYWTSTRSDMNPGAKVMGIMFSNGNIVEGAKETSGRIEGTGFENYGFTFAVRDINPGKDTNVEETLKIYIKGEYQLMIAQPGYPYVISYIFPLGSAKSYIEELNNNNFKSHNDWRLPDLNELREIYNKRDLINSNVNFVLEDGNYWSSTVSMKNGDGTYYYIKNLTTGKERNDYLADGFSSTYYKASLVIVRNIEKPGAELSGSELEKYTGTFKSQHPSLDRIELIKSNDILLLKLFRDSTITEFESTLIKSDTLYFTTPEINRSKAFNELYGKTYRYQVIFPNGINSLILKNASGQIIRATKEQ